MTRRAPPIALLLAAALPLLACGGADGDGPETPEPGAEAAAAGTADARAGRTPDREEPEQGADEAPTAEDRDAPAAAGTGEGRPENGERRRVGVEPTNTPMVPGEAPAEETPPGDTAEEPGAADDAGPRVRSAPAGTQLWATLDDSLDTETARVGDRFEATVASPVTDGAYVLVPEGARLEGRVTRVRRARRDSAALIGIAFDSVTVRERTLPIAATVTDVKLEKRSELRGERKKIGLGAAAGAVLGAVVGEDVKGVLIGAAGGAAAGTAVALGTKARYAVLPAGSEVTLRLDDPLEVPLPEE